MNKKASTATLAAAKKKVKRKQTRLHARRVSDSTCCGLMCQRVIRQEQLSDSHGKDIIKDAAMFETPSTTETFIPLDVAITSAILKLIHGYVRVCVQHRSCQSR